MFNNLAIRGNEGTIVRGWRTAVRFTSWVVHKSPEGEWSISGPASEVDAFLVRQPLGLLTALPRPGRLGFWTFSVKSITVHNNRSVSAKLGPPVQ